jgi:hypothetical protein
MNNNCSLIGAAKVRNNQNNTKCFKAVGTVNIIITTWYLASVAE